MAASYFGRGAAYGFGVESTWGTPVALTNWLRAMPGADLRRDISKVPRNPLHMGGAVNSSLSHYVSKDDAGGSSVFEVGYQNFGLIWKHLVNDTNVTDTGTGPYTHVYAPTETETAGLTVEQIKGRTPTAVRSETFEGMKIKDGTLSISPGGVLTCQLNWLGETSAARAAASTPSYGADAPVLHHHAGQMNINSVAYTIRDMTIKVDRKLPRRDQLGSKNMLEPLPSGPYQVTCDVTLEVQDALYTLFTADTEFDADITFTSGTNSVKFDLFQAFVGSYSDPTSGPEMLTSKLQLVCQSDGTNDQWKVTTVNDQSSAIGNG